MVNISFSDRTVTQEGSDYFYRSTENSIRMISCDSLKNRKQQILFHCRGGMNLKIVSHMNRMKPMEKFAFKSPQN